MHYRSAIATDCDPIAALHIAGGQAAYAAILPADYLADIMPAEKQALWRMRLSHGVDDTRIAVTVAESGTDLTGFCCFDFEQDNAFGTYLHNIYVSGSHQRLGVASGLLRASIDRFSILRLGAPVHLLVFASNGPARAFYDRLGGTVVEYCKRKRDGSAPIQLCRYQWESAEALRTAAQR